MLKVAVNTIPLETGHKFRGVGAYTRNLIMSLEIRDFIEVVKFKRMKEIGGVDVVHFPWFDFFFRTLPIVKKFPTIVTVHDVIPLVFPQAYPIGIKGKINFFLQKLALQTCRFIITDSQNSANDISRFLKISRDKIKVILLAPDPQFKILSDAKNLLVRRKYKLPDHFILYVGDANFTKNLPFLIEGFRKLIKRQNFADVKLVLAGDVFLKKIFDHPELESLGEVNRQIDQFKLDKAIFRPGQIEGKDLVGFYNLATVYVQPSLYEGFGLPILEAMRCGCPVISSDAASLKEVGGDAALYFNPQNLDQFVRVLNGVLQNRSLQQKLSILGQDWVRKFSWERVADETIKVYQAATL